jgi:hypothetical protein
MVLGFGGLAVLRKRLHQQFYLPPENNIQGRQKRARADGKASWHAAQSVAAVEARKACL